MPGLGTLFRYWFTFASRVSPRQYLTHGAALMLTKYASDVALVQAGVGRWWLPGAYVQSVPQLQETALAGAPAWLMPLLALWTMPFLWAGITLTMRRCVDANMSPWLSLLFFVPYVNYTLIAALCVLPSRGEPLPPLKEALGGDQPRYLMAMLPGLVLGAGMIALSVYAFRSYGVALFFATPFAVGAITAWVLNRTFLVTPGQTRQLVLLTLGTLAVLLLVLGREGAVCIVMAAPLAAVVGVMGGVAGREIAMMGQHASMRSATLGFLVLPMALVLEPRAGTGVVQHEVRSSVEIAASPDVVWSQVVAFPPMPEPTDWFFQLGVAYPKHARIEGTGVGAVRYCVFSTGPFVEPITTWEPGHRLAFDVRSAPEALRELTPYRDVHPPHLDGFLQSRRGEFRLIALPNGHTRLEGSTWYTLEMGPEGYWQLFGDHIIHRIHRRVLDHIKVQAERGAAAAIARQV